MDDYDTVLLGLWKYFHFSSKRGCVLEPYQVIYGKKSLKIVKAGVTCWLWQSFRAYSRLPS